MKAVHHLTRTTRILLITATVLLALVLTTVRLILPLAEDYRHDLELQAAEVLGKPVRIAKIRAHLRGFLPELLLKEVKILSPDGSTVSAQLKEVRVGLSMVNFLRSGQFSPLWITLVGAELGVIRKEDGSFSVHGFGSGGQKSEFPTWLFQDGRYEVISSKVTWRDLKRKVAEIELREVEIILLNDGNRHQLNIKTVLPEAKGRSLSFKIDYEGDISRVDGWQGKLYADGQGISPASLLKSGDLGVVSLERGAIDFQIWGEWKASAFQSIQGAINFDKPVISRRANSAGETGKVSLDEISGWFRWQRDGSDWNLEVTDFVIKEEEHPAWPETATTISRRDQTLSMASSYFNIADVRGWLIEAQVLNDSQIEILTGFEPAGELADLSLSMTLSSENFSQAWFCGRFNELSFDSWEKAPGLEHAEGRFCGTEKQGFIELGSGATQLNIANLFRTPWQLKNSLGRFYWQKGEESWRVFSDQFALDTLDIKTVSRFELVVGKGKAPFLDLQTSFRDGIVANAGFYYPENIMPRKVVNWLDRALVSGRVLEGGALYRGRLDKFPFAENEGVFEVLFNVDDTTLNYQQHWPPLTGIGAEVRFFQDDLIIKADKAVLEGETVAQTEVSIFNLKHANWLNISGEVSGGVEQSMRFLKESPLHNRVDQLLEVMDVGGNNLIKIAINVPLRAGIGPAKVKGTARLKNANLKIHGIDLDVSKISGVINFSEQGIDAKGLRAVVLDGAVKVDLIHQQEDTLLKAKGMVGITALNRQFPMKLWPYLKGQTAYELELKIPTNATSEKELSTELVLTSNTDGISVNLPAPYGKKEEEMRPFLFSLPLQKGKQSEMSMKFGKILQAKLIFSDPGESVFKFARGELRLDSEQTVLPEKGLRLAGHLSRLEITPWADFIEAHSSDRAKRASESDLLQELDLSFDNLIVGERKFANVELQLARKEKSWVGKVASSLGRGFARIPDDLKGVVPVVLNFDYLKIPSNDSKSDEPQKKTPINPTDFPNLNVKARQLFWKDNNLGSLELVTNRIEQGLKVSRLLIESEKDHLQLSGHWIGTGAGENQTILAGRLESKEVGVLVSRLVATKELEVTEGELDFSLKWSGEPWDISLAALNGKLGLKLGKGRLLNLEPGVGRLFGLLSLQTIQRRLSLDFSDVFSKGLSFDKIEAHYKLEAGNSYTEDFFLDSPVSRIDIAGRMGLADRDFDQVVVVTPKTTANLPIAGAIVGGPVVGAAVYLAQKLVGKRLESVTHSRYSLTGSWDEPVLTEIGKDQPWSRKLFDRVWSGLSGQDPLSERK